MVRPQLRGRAPINAYAAHAILYWFGDKKHEKKYGDRVTFEADGRLIVGLFEEHPADAGINHPHPGCSLLDAGPIKR